MFSYKCTKALTKKLGRPVTADPQPPTTRLGDWYGNVLNVGHERLMIFLSDRSFLPIIMPLREHHQLLRNFKKRLAFLLVRLDVDAHLISAELDKMDTVIIAPTASRSILASMNDFVSRAKHNFALYEITDLTELELRLAGVPCGLIEYNLPNRLGPALLAGKKS